MSLAALCAGAHEADPEKILNYVPIDASLTTSGQVHPMHIPIIEREAFELVINLAVADQERNLEESFHITDKGISYVQIPVVWENPTQGDLDLFFAVMDARKDRNTLVHCFANYRASAFTYLYRVLREGVPEAEARKKLEAVWNEEAFEEYPQWRTFIDSALGSQ